MYELDCSGIIPGCARVIRADSESEVFRRAVIQAERMGYNRVPTTMLDRFRHEMIDVDSEATKLAG
ncbi:DUF1059 domain-containing protein [Fulvimarina sp. 2208YS6-2-32]|uniref:DUF1059 domain-containing protein n=1 Tax=Fulvimarina uroteuthidis TaxID=3098149 RepID=A0ABU5I569_9HYPH|nr:DUF1059 domain-containing protein [Fulvimarina sp. 2208YS6-2-32]MDY8110524.1 DUF1059 domain-containing protein [Fulvimarina sp. 2208YS6-2-32]